MPETLVACCRLRVTTCDGPVDLQPGDVVPVEKIAPKKLANLKARHCVVCGEAKNGTENETASKIDSLPETAAPPVLDSSQGVLAVSIESLDLQPQVIQSLLLFGLKTVGDIAMCGKKNGSLTKITGIGEATEKAIQAAISKLG